MSLSGRLATHLLLVVQRLIYDVQVFWLIAFPFRRPSSFRTFPVHSGGSLGELHSHQFHVSPQLSCLRPSIHTGVRRNTGAEIFSVYSCVQGNASKGDVCLWVIGDTDYALPVVEGYTCYVQNRLTRRCPILSTRTSSPLKHSEGASGVPWAHIWVGRITVVYHLSLFQGLIGDPKKVWRRSKWIDRDWPILRLQRAA